MRTKKIELDVDFIGGQTSLTKEEKIAISEFIQRTKKLKKLVSRSKKIRQLI